MIFYWILKLFVSVIFCFQFIIYACIMCIARFFPQTQEVLSLQNNMFLSVWGTSSYISLTVCVSPTAMFRALIVWESAYLRERNSLTYIWSARCLPVSVFPTHIISSHTCTFISISDTVRLILVYCRHTFLRNRKYYLCSMLDDCKRRNERETKRNETSRNESKRKETQEKRNEAKRDTTETKRNKTKYINKKWNEH